MIITYHGHSCIQIKNGEHSIIVDPFLTGNPLAISKPEEIHVQYVLLTHGHGDHVGDAVEIAKRNDATIVATAELATYLSWQGVKVSPMNLGGTSRFAFGNVQLTNAFHSSSVIEEETGKIIYMGMPAGLLITVGEKTIYHAGDTGLFGDMKLLGERYSIDLAFLPIGDVFTMGPSDAVQAAEWIKAKAVVPIHYNTFPPITQDGDSFIRALQAKQISGYALKPGESIDY